MITVDQRPEGVKRLRVSRFNEMHIYLISDNTIHNGKTNALRIPFKDKVKAICGLKA